MNNNTELGYYPLKNSCDVRFGDTDMQGHVNNAVFSTFLEVGRVQIMYNPNNPLAEPDTEFVIARLELDYKAEIAWPGKVDIGSKILAVGNSSFLLEQAVFQHHKCVAYAKAVLVHIGKLNKRPTAITPNMRQKMLAFM